MKAQRRPQAQKARVKRVQELRRSNAAQPIPSGNRYDRKGKYVPDYFDESEEDIDFSEFDWK